MKFDASLKPQDKRTIGIVFYIAIIALFSWYMIRPAAMKMIELNDKIKEAQATKQEYKMKSMQLGTAEILYDKAVTAINASTKDFYDVLDNSKIEKMGTSYILGYGLTPVDFRVDLRDGSYVTESPYTYANVKKAKTTISAPAADTTTTTVKDSTVLTALDVKSLQTYYTQAIAGVTNTAPAQVQCARISIVVQGPHDKCQTLINDITKKPSIRVTSFSWSDAKEVWSTDEKGNKTLMNPDYKELRMDLYFYMTEKPNYEQKEA